MTEALPPVGEQGAMPPQPRIVVHHQQQSISAFVGPVPPPEMLEGFRQVDPSLPTRLVGMAEQEQAHRHKKESTLVEAHIATGRRGQFFALIVALAGFSLAAYGAYLGHPGTAFLFAGTELALLVGLFLSGQREKKAESPPPPGSDGPKPGKQTEPPKLPERR